MLTSITISRLVLAIIAIPLLEARTPETLSWALALLLAIEATDFLDGRIARKHGMVSDFGKLLDPLMDSLARFTVFATFLHMGLAPLWMVLIFFYRDMLVAYMRSLASTFGVIMMARPAGKLKALVQGVVLASATALLLADALRAAPGPVSAVHVFMPCVLCSLVTLAIVAGFRLWHQMLWLVLLAAVLTFAGLYWLWAFRPDLGPVVPVIWWLLFAATAVTGWSLLDYALSAIRISRAGKTRDP